MGKVTLREIPQLLWVNLIVQVKNIVEYCRVIFAYYTDATFRQIDIFLLREYLFANPFHISKQFLSERGEADIYAYGETPLTTFDYIVQTCGINRNDVVYELGCGRGRTCFWLHQFVNCKVVGVDYVPLFIEKANTVVEKFNLKGIEFRCQDILDLDLQDATVIYLYGSNFSEEFIEKVITLLSGLPSGVRVITVSYPLSDYTSAPLFDVTKTFSCDYTWGKADLFLQIKK